MFLNSSNTVSAFDFFFFFFFFFLSSGCGMTIPDPQGSYTGDDKMEIPMGKGVPSNVNNSSLLYNEYPFLFSLLGKCGFIYLTIYFTY